LAERPFLDQSLGAAILRREAQHLAVHQLDACRLDRCEHSLGFGQATGERLFAQDMLARLRRRRDDFLVQIVRHRDRDRVDVVALEDFFIVLVGVGDAPLVLGLKKFTTPASTPPISVPLVMISSIAVWSPAEAAAPTCSAVRGDTPAARYCARIGLRSLCAASSACRASALPDANASRQT